MKTKDLKRQLTSKRTTSQTIPNKDLLSTGSTVLNLALSGKVRGGFAKGKFYFIVGDSNSGKTWVSLTCFAEASINPNFEGYRYIHDNAEDGALMDMEKFFGARVNERIEPPGGTREMPVYSSTIEEFYYHVDDALDKGVPFIYVLDSMDALEASEDRKKFKERKNARRKAEKSGKEEKVTGSYGMAKAKANSTGMRSVIARLKNTGSILIVISQTRDAVGFDAMFKEKTRSGGKALRFYAHCEFWTSVVSTIKKKVLEKNRKLGIKVRAKVEKNRQTGRLIEADFPIYWSFGMDDLGGCVDYLVDEGHWQMKKGVIGARELELQLPREQLVRVIEEKGIELQLKTIVSQVWDQIKVACSPTRKKRYT